MSFTDEDRSSVGERLVRIETHLELLLKRIDPMLTDLEGRIRRLERLAWAVMGFAMTLGGAAGAVVSKIFP